MAWRLMRNLIFAAFLFISNQSQAADAYYDYLSDLFLHESHQAHNPDQIIRYADGENGALLQSVLDPKRVKATLDMYYEKRNTYAVSKNYGESLHDIPRFLRPLISRYEKAFEKDHKAYEAEYLDSIEDSLEIFEGYSVTMATIPTISPTKTKTKTNSISEADAATIKNATDRMKKFANNFIAGAYKEIATELRSQVAKGMFTENGAKRALTIADRIAPNNLARAECPEWVEF